MVHCFLDSSDTSLSHTSPCPHETEERCTYPRHVNRILINKSTPHPATKKAPAGGKRMVTKTTIIAEAAPMFGLYDGFPEY